MNGSFDELLEQIIIFYHRRELKDDIVSFYDDLKYDPCDIQVRYDWETDAGSVAIRCNPKKPIMELTHWQWKEACAKHTKTFIGRKLNII